MARNDTAWSSEGKANLVTGGYGGYGQSEEPRHERYGRRQDESGFETRREDESSSYSRETGYGSGGYQQSYGRRDDRGFK